MPENLGIINRIGEEITSTLQLDEVIRRLYEELSKMMDATGFIIYLLDKKENCLRVKHVFGKHKGIVSETIPMNSEESFCVYSIKYKAEIFMNDVKRDHSQYLENYYWKEVPDDDIIHSFINIPLVIRGEAFGVVSVQSFKRQAYNKEHLDLLKSMAAYMSIAFSNAESFSQLNAAREAIEEQKRIIEEKNEDILGSIRYAVRIQTSLLPTDKYIERSISRLKKELE